METTHEDRVTIITDEMSRELRNHKIEDTSENRYYFLSGMRSAWFEDREIELEKTEYLASITQMINSLRNQLQNQK